MESRRPIFSSIIKNITSLASSDKVNEAAKEELAALGRELEHALFDTAKSLPNLLRLEHDLKQSPPEEGSFVLTFDIKSLRKINDAYSRKTADLLLTEIVEWVRSIEIKNFKLYHADVDEFIILLRNTTSDEAKELAVKIHNRFNDAWILKNKPTPIQIFCSVKFGLIDLYKHFYNHENLLSLIERALDYSGKIGDIAIYDEAIDFEFKNNLMLELNLKDCVLEGMRGFSVDYQAIVDAKTGLWVGVEALCRWKSPEFGNVSPMKFIPKSEQLGLIGHIGDWVLETAVKQCKLWDLDKFPNFMLHVNLSPLQLIEGCYDEKLAATLKKYGYPGPNLSLEITESIEFNFENYIMAEIAKVRAHGVLMSLDDFGTGYSSFNNLKKLPVSILKTERSFIIDIENDIYLQYLLHVMVNLAHAVDMRMVAEGVETEQQLELLLENGVDLLQGFLFCKPLPADEFEKLLQNFSIPPRQIGRGLGENITINRLLDARNEYTLSPAAYRLFNRCLQILVTYTETEKSISDVLELACKRITMTHAGMFTKDEKGVFSCTYEWCDNGVKELKPELQRVNLDKKIPKLLPTLAEYGIVYAQNINSLSFNASKFLEDKGIKCIAILPMLSGGEIIGFTAVASQDPNSKLFPEDLLLFYNLSTLFASISSKRKLELELIQENATKTEIFENIDIPIHVTDCATRELLFANKCAREQLSNERPIIGAKCYEVLVGSDSPCSLCELYELLNNPSSKSNVREHYDEQTNRYYKIHDSIITWTGGKQAYLQYTIDITAIKIYQSQLEFVASIDSLTGALNRGTLMSSLRHLFELSNITGDMFSICFVDVDMLKHINDTYGHTQGDVLVKSVVDKIRITVRKDDLIGRYGGDEFVVVMKNCAKNVVEKKMIEARKILQSESSDLDISFSFSYGIAESNEVKHSDIEVGVEKLIEIADKRMLDFKKKVFGGSSRKRL